MAYSAPMRSQRFRRHRRFVRDVQIVELSAHVRPAGRFLNASCFVDLIETRVAIGLQRAREAAQVRFRMLALAIRRVGEPHRWRRRVSRGPIIAHVGPQPPGFCFAVARRQHRNRRVIGMQLRSPPSRDAAALPPAAQVTRSFRPPSPPASSVPAPRLLARKFPTADTTASDRSTSRPAHAPDSPGPAMPRSIGRLGASACTMRSQHAQASFGRTCRITLKCAGTYSSISETSSPRCFNSPPQSGQAFCFGGYFRVSRGRCSGNGRRAGFAAFVAGAEAAGVCEGATFSACVASSSSSRNSSCSISRSSFSDLRPNCMRRSLAISSFKCSISVSREASCSFLREKLFVLEEDQRLQCSVIECVEIRKCCAQRHRARSMPETFLCASKKRRERKNSKEKCVTETTAASHRHLRSVTAHRPPPVDPFQQHRQLRRRQRNRSARRLRPGESSALQPLREQAQPVAVPPQQLDQIAALPAKHKHLPRKRIFLQRRLHHPAQAPRTRAACPSRPPRSRCASPPPTRSSQQLLQHHTQCFRIHAARHAKMSFRKFHLNHAGRCAA